MQPDYVIQLAGQEKDWVEIMTALLAIYDSDGEGYLLDDIVSNTHIW